MNVLGIKVQGESKVVVDVGCEARIEESQQRLVSVSNQDKRVRIRSSWLIIQEASLQHKLVGAESSIFEEDKLVLVGIVEETSWILSDREMESLDSKGGAIRSIVGVDLEFGTTETDLDIVGGGGEDRFVGEGDFVCNGVRNGIELEYD